MADRERVHQNFLDLADGPCSVLVFDDEHKGTACGRLGEAVVTAGGPIDALIALAHYQCADHGGSSPE